MSTKQIIIGIVGLILVIAPAVLLAKVYHYYRQYYIYMKNVHRGTWENLMKKDSAVELIGEWYRWPFGSGYLIKSFFTRNKENDDETIIRLKSKSILCLKLFVITLLFAIIFIVELP